ncbi:MAG TPA: hypothetical protein VK707_09105 [Solirubrobacteraceae bacterium]|nr:hypothetical protein [Solirubrobacteraceae bacterium]
MKAHPAVAVTAAIVVLAALLMPGSATAASPVLEFVTPGHSLPVKFTTESGAVNAEMVGFESLVHCAASHGEGEITGPRSTVSEYRLTGCVTEKGSHQKCKSKGAQEEEIETGPIDAELVFIDQATHEVGVLLDPSGGTYIAFECGGEAAEGRGPFLAPVTPINKEATAFTATLSQTASAQTPDEYETLTGERLPAIPTGRHGSNSLVMTGVEATFAVHPSSPVEIKATTAVEVLAEEHARQVAEEARKREEEATAAASAKRHQEEAAARKHHEEEVAAASKRQEEEGSAGKKREEAATAALKAAIGRALTPGGKATKIGALLKHGGLTLAFDSPESGALVIQWWQAPPGAHLAKRGKSKPALVAQAVAAFSGAGVRNVKIRLTREGRRLLAHATEVKLTTRVRFTPTAHPAISATGVFTLRR